MGVGVLGVVEINGSKCAGHTQRRAAGLCRAGWACMASSGSDTCGTPDALPAWTPTCKLGALHVV